MLGEGSGSGTLGDGLNGIGGAAGGLFIALFADFSGDGAGGKVGVFEFFDDDACEFFDVGEELALIGADEGPGDAAFTGAGGSADAVDVDFGVFGEVVVDDMADVFNVEAPGGQIGSDEDIEIA